MEVIILFIIITDAMENLLEEECRREHKLREYEEGRAEITRTLLSQLVLCFKIKWSLQDNIWGNGMNYRKYRKKQEKKEETLTKKMKRSPDERHTQTHGSLIKMFR